MLSWAIESANLGSDYIRTQATLVRHRAKLNMWQRAKLAFGFWRALG